MSNFKPLASECPIFKGLIEGLFHAMQHLEPADANSQVVAAELANFGGHLVIWATKRVHSDASHVSKWVDSAKCVLI